MKTIKSRFIVTAVTISLFLLALGLFTNLYITRIHEGQVLLQQLQQLQLIKERMENNEKNFMLNEAVSFEFFSSGESRFIEGMDSLFLEKDTVIRNISSNRIVKRLDLHENLLGIDNQFQELGQLFDNLTLALYEHGYRGFGLSGKMRSHIHKVEDILELDDRYELKVMMLTLRRFEKNFMLRRDPQYIERFRLANEDFKARVAELGIYPQLIQYLEDYHSAFVELARKNMEIGSITDGGLVFDIYKKFRATEPAISKMQDRIITYSQNQVRLYNTGIVIAFLILSFSIIFVYYKLSHRIVSQLTTLGNYIGLLGKGELPEKILNEGNDEISKMIDSVNILTDNLKNTRSFALEVGKGNFNTEINVFGNKGDLGGSLIKMKNQLEEIARLQVEQKEDELKRTWNAEGMALFGQILRQNAGEISVMIDALVKNIVKYLGANQAGIFLVYDDETGNQAQKYFELAGCYAYDRKKFLTKRILWGEGLIGAVGLEKDYIYLTDLPADYISITSGLGEAPPDYVFIVPLLHEEVVLGVMEIAGFKNLEEHKRAFAISLSQAIASQIHIMKANVYTAELLKRSEALAYNMREKEEELRQTIEELTAAREDSDNAIQKIITKNTDELRDTRQVINTGFNGSDILKTDNEVSSVNNF